MFGFGLYTEKASARTSSSTTTGVEKERAQRSRYFEKDMMEGSYHGIQK